MSLSNCVGLSGLGIAFYWLAFTCRTASNSRVDSQLAHQNSHQSSFVEFSPRLASPSLCRNTTHCHATGHQQEVDEHEAKPHDHRMYCLSGAHYSHAQLPEHLQLCLFHSRPQEGTDNGTEGSTAELFTTRACAYCPTSEGGSWSSPEGGPLLSLIWSRHEDVRILPDAWA